MIRIETATYAESVISTPMWAISEPRGHREGDHVHGAALHAAGHEPVEQLSHFGRVAPVVSRAGVDLLL